MICRYLEILKLRFGDTGEDSLYQCEVMLKDMRENGVWINFAHIPHVIDI